MAKIEAFIKSARAKGLDDNDIKEALIEQGWKKGEIVTALSGVAVPKPESTGKGSDPHTIHPLFAALQHVLLWFFIASSSISIAAVVSSITGSNVNPQALASLIAVTAITFTPYAVFYIFYLNKLRKDPRVIPGNIWSIITVCLHSLGTLAAAIVLVVALITNGESSTIISSAIMLTLYGIVVATYSFAAFAHPGKLRRAILYISLPILALIMGTLFTLSMMRIGPSLEDQNTRKDMVSSMQSIAEFIAKENRIPEDNEGQDLLTSQDITYKKQTVISYELCATFNAGNTSSDLFEAPYFSLIDAYPHESQFATNKAGEACFSVESSYLTLDTSDFKN